MTAEGVVDLYSGLLARNVRIWVDGGWGIDALLGRQTRPHKDLDAITAFEDLPILTAFLSGRGFSLKLIWEENRWTPETSPITSQRPRGAGLGGTRPRAFRAEILKFLELVANLSSWHPSGPTHRSLEGEAWEDGRGVA